MTYNMNLTFPVADWAMSTSDLSGACWAISSTATTRARQGGAQAGDGSLPHLRTQAERCTLDGPRLNDDELNALGRAVSHA